MRSLAEDIRHRTDEELVALLDLRPDLARPQPADLTALAARASTRASTARAVDHLDLPHLAALEACVVADEVSPAAVAPLLATDVETAATLLEDLTAAALLWRAADGRVVSRTVVDVLGAAPAGLGPRAADLHHDLPEDLGTVVAGLAPESRRVLDRVAWHGPTAARPRDPASRTAAAVTDLLAARLLAATDDERHVVAPLEVGLAARGGRLPDGPLEGPDTGEVRRLDPDDVDQAATAAATELVGLLDELLDHVDELVPRVLRSGGLAVRDLRLLASRTDLQESTAGFLLELALAAGLLADDAMAEPSWRLTTQVETWRSLAPAPRWTVLAEAWRDSLRSAAAPGPEDGGRVNALSGALVWPPVRALRRELLEILADLPAGSAPTAELVVDLLHHRRPRRMPRDAAGVVGQLLRELELLGVTGRSALGGVGRLLLTGRDEVEEALGRLLPDPVDRVLLQADLTAVVPGTPVPELASLLRSTAEIESRGGAGVHRFTETTLRAAFDAGWGADELLDALARFSATEVPQPLEYLVRDVGRRHGQLRVGESRSYLRSDDPAHLEALRHHRELGHLQLRQVAPTVLVSPVGPTVLLDSLRRLGESPALEGTGGVVTAAASRRRATPARERPVTEVPREPAADVLARLRAAEEEGASRRTVEDGPGPSIPALDPASASALLREAAADRLPVWLGVSDGLGATRRVLFHPRKVDGGRVVGEVDATPQVYSLHRITGVVIDG